MENKNTPETLTPEQTNSSSFIDLESVNKRSKEMFEKTLKEFNSLKPEQMESGKWYWIETEFNWLVKFKEFKDNKIYDSKIFDISGNCNFTKISTFLTASKVKTIRPATKEEVLKYFPDEKWSEKIDEIIDTHVIQKLKPEPIELRPEDLVSGEVYKAVKDSEFSFIFRFVEKKDNMICHDGLIWLNIPNKKSHGWILDTNKFYHATPEEKKLLLGEEQTELENIKKLLEESNRLYALKTIEFTKLQEKYEELQDLSDAIKEDWDKKVEEIEHLKSKQQLEPKGEKVYFYFDRDMEKFDYSESLDEAKINSEECQPIYEAVCIGKKKSVLVSE